MMGPAGVQLASPQFRQGTVALGSGILGEFYHNILSLGENACFFFLNMLKVLVCSIFRIPLKTLPSTGNSVLFLIIFTSEQYELTEN